MERQIFSVNADGEIIEHATDFEAVGRNLREWVSGGSWDTVRAAMDCVCESGEPVQCVAAGGCPAAAFSMVLSVSRIDGQKLRIVAREAVDLHADLTLSEVYRVILLKPGQPAATVEFETPNQREAVRWLNDWLDEPLGLVPAVVPPSS